MLKEKTIEITKPLKKESFIQIAKGQKYDIKKIDKEIINKIIKKRNDFYKLYDMELITKEDLTAIITSINAIALETNGTLWAVFKVTIYSK